MLKRIAIGFGIVVFAVPVFASAAVVTGNSDQLIALYTKLVQLLQQELSFLQNKPHASVSVAPSSGPAPLSVVFTVGNRSETEALDFGDGHSTGSNGCKKNQGGYCDLSQPISHTYQLPGSYTAKLYDSSSGEAKVVQTMTVSVNAPH
ncbi:hypothetical protein HY968_02955 [Candidatus Kaiserbacteria bacterium]|nr:hypothetical protein [Candidatus Kaiserbacteria bacterium]